MVIVSTQKFIVLALAASLAVALLCWWYWFVSTAVPFRVALESLLQWGIIVVPLGTIFALLLRVAVYRIRGASAHP